MITSNFSRSTLVRGVSVKAAEQGGGNITFTLPTLADVLDIDGFSQFGGFISAPLDELQKKLHIKAESRLELLLKMAGMRELTDFTLLFFGCLFRYMVGVEYVDDCIRAEDYTLTPQMFDYYCMCTSIACGYKKFTEIETLNKVEEPKTPEELEYERRAEEAERRIRQLRSKDAGSFESTAAHMTLVVAFEFKYKVDEVYGLTVFAVNELYRTCWLAASDRIEVAAFGGGNKEKNAKYKYLKEV